MEELEARIKECNIKGADYDLVSQKATAAARRRRTTANTPAGRRLFFIPNCITVRSEERRCNYLKPKLRNTLIKHHFGDCHSAYHWN